MPHSLTPYLSVTVAHEEGIPVSTILRTLPIGWEVRFRTLIMELDDISPNSIVKLDIRDGVLYISLREQSKYHQLTTLSVRALSQESARTCMICGDPGIRRKEQEHKPCLCRVHYLDFINYTEE